MKRIYKNGMIVTGCVTGIEKYGIFVSLDDYYSGLIHISEISDSFVRNVSDYVSIGETIKVKIIDIDDNSFHAKLSIKNLKYKISNKKRLPIVETVHGFDTLKLNLERWIEEKEREILSKK